MVPQVCSVFLKFDELRLVGHWQPRAFLIAQPAVDGAEQRAPADGVDA